MHLFHIPQCSIHNRNVHISILNGALWDIEQVHSGIFGIGLFDKPLSAPLLPWRLSILRAMRGNLKHKSRSSKLWDVFSGIEHFNPTHRTVQYYDVVLPVKEFPF